MTDKGILLLRNDLNSGDTEQRRAVIQNQKARTRVLQIQGWSINVHIYICTCIGIMCV